MSLAPSPTQSNVLTALRSFLLSILPDGGAVFTGEIAGAQLTILSIQDGAVSVGDSLLGEGVYSGATITAFGTGTGGVGTYVLSVSQTLPSTKMATGVEVILAQENRVPEPSVPDFVTMTPLFQTRLSTNVDTYQDVSFTASIGSTVMDVTAVAFGTIAVGQIIFGIGVSALTKVTAIGTGTGGVGTYTVSPTQTVGSRKLASGGETFLQPTRVTIQLDVHGPNSADNAQTISTLFRDDYAVQFFKGTGFDVKALRTIVRLRKQDADERREHETILETYMHALGMLN